MPDLRLATIFGNDMILQQKAVIKLFGFAKSDARVTIELERFPADSRQPADKDTQYGLLFSEEDIAGKDGYFEFRLPALLASYDPCRMTVRSGPDVVVIDDILIGEVWFAAGQDNMAQTVRTSDAESLLVDCVNLSATRFFQMSVDGLSDLVKEYSYTPLGEAQGGEWQRGDQTYLMGDISAIAFTFARDLHYAWDIPVGVVIASCPGTYIHSWLPREIIESDPVMKNHIREVRLYRDRDSWNSETAEREREEIAGDFNRRTAFPRPQTVALLDGRRPDRSSPAPLVVPRASIRKSNVAQNVIPLDHEYSPRNQPSAMFNHKVAPFVGLSLRGILWMQGESDADSPEYYLRAFRYLIDTLNEIFEPVDRDLVLIVSQLPPYLYNGLGAFGLAIFNEMLARACHVFPVNAGLVTVYDLPLDYQEQPHTCAALTPYAKREIGKRMAKTATGLVKVSDLPAGAPEPISMELIGNKWMIDFTPQAVRGHGLQLKAGDTVLKGFAICDESRVFVKAEARILYGVRVLVWHDYIDDPISITYAYSTFNGDSNLTGTDGVPVLPFRVDLESSDYLIPMPWSDCDRLTQFGWGERLKRDAPHTKNKDLPGERPLWSVSKGRAELTLTQEIHGYSRSDLLLEYRNADERPVEIDAAVALASAYPPLDLTPYDAMELIVLNPDHWEKHIQLLLEDSNGVVFESVPRKIEDAFRQQSIVWGNAELANDTNRITRLAFRILDPGAKGSLIFIRVKMNYKPAQEQLF
ncbi:MAG: sialate O-acetylesterase [Clostridiaceae bacterium]|nr:sialate O-acetylesterase [Clostridiaceae bacterium]